MVTCEVVIDIDGAQKHLKDSGKDINKEVNKIICLTLGEGEKVMKCSVPVRKSFLKNSIYSSQTGKLCGQVYATVAYAIRRNYENNLHPDKKFYIEKTREAMERYLRSKL